MSRIRIGSRGSTLALAQATWVKTAIVKQRPDAQVELVAIKTGGDRFVDTAIQSIGGKGIFTKEIEDALLRNEIDIAVHSMKDLPTELPDELTIAAVPQREDPRDVLVSRSGDRLEQLPAGAKIGTGSLRRRAQILHYRPELSVVPIRGNVDTRLNKLDAGEVDAVIMAAAGLKRIGRGDRIVEFISADICVSAVAQGALALETRQDASIRETLDLLDDIATYTEVSAERAFLSRLGGGCQVPVGARATVQRGKLDIIGVIANPDGSSLFRGERAGPATDAIELGQELAEQLLDQGADKILAKLDRQHSYHYGES
jgi:hydroxymethylbilane synthase